MDFELMQDRIEQCREISTVPYSSYEKLEKELDALRMEYEDFKSEIFFYAKNDDMGKLVEYLKLKGVF